jgi:hypothetical protein
VKKVEELTLYLIKMDKDREEQQSLNQAQQDEIKLLKQQVAGLLQAKLK